MYYTERELDIIGMYCEKLYPEAKINVQTGDRLLVIFPDHKVCLIKEPGGFKMHSYPQDNHIGGYIDGGWKSPEEASFGVLAYLTEKLPVDKANSLLYEANPQATRH